jgi:uncharacterized protein YcfL
MIRPSLLKPCLLTSLSLLLLLPGATFPQATLAEIPPSGYRNLQERAQEALNIQVMSVEVKPAASGKLNVTVLADVTEVQRSQAKLKRGNKIKIQYQIYDYSRIKPTDIPPGAPPAPLLDPGKVYSAFLNRAESGESFTPAAYRLSFTPIRR